MPTLESLFSGVSPQCTLGGDPTGQDAVLDLSLAAAGMRRECWEALLWRYLRDDMARSSLYRRLVGKSRKARSRLVQERAGPLARLVLAEEHSQLETLYASEAEHILLTCSRREWSDTLRPAFLQLRGALDLWARAGAAHIRRRLADG